MKAIHLQMAAILASLAGFSTVVLAAAEPAQQICMASTNSQGAQFIIAVPPDHQQAMAERGFVTRPCGDLSNNIVQYCDKICTFSQSMTPSLRSRFQEDMGVEPNELCAMAQQILAKKYIGQP